MTGLNHAFSRITVETAKFAGKPVAFIGATGFILVWAVTGPFFNYSESWQLVVNTTTTIITFLMLFILQNTQNRDMAAMQTKLDALIAASEARNELMGIDDKDVEEIALERERLKKEC